MARPVILPMIDPPPASLRLTIDTQALADNWRMLNRLSGAASAGAAVKADAYGLGVAQVLPTLMAAGARDFFVAHWAEVAAVLQYVSPLQISVLHGVSSAPEAAYACALGVRPVINSLQQAQVWHAAGGGPCDLMVDTGINRLGVVPQDISDPAIAALDVQVLMSHLASADEDVALNLKQLAAFRDVAQHLPHNLLSLANSAGIALGKDYAFDLTRPGLSLYGGVARAELGDVIRQVVFPQAMVIQRRRLSPGESVGYNATFKAENELEVATVSMGYADGFLRCRGPGGALGFAGADLPIIGRVSMDMTVVDCSRAPQLAEGDFVDVPFALPQVAESSGLSQYELLTLLGKRFSRHA